MANSNLAVAANNMLFLATAPTLPNNDILSKINPYDTAIIVDDIARTIKHLNKKSPVLIEYIGELDFFNEVTGLAGYISNPAGVSGGVYDYRHDASERDYPQNSKVIILKGIDCIMESATIIIDATEMNVYRVTRR